jgi:serine protease Do
MFKPEKIGKLEVGQRRLAFSTLTLLALACLTNPAVAADAPSGVAIGRQISSGIYDAAERVKPAVVIVKSMVIPPPPPAQQGQPPPPRPTQPPSASGLIIDDDGYIVTSSAVVQNTASVEVTIPARQNRKYFGKVLGTSATHDIALVHIEAKGLPTATIGDSNSVKSGQWVIAIGAPFGLSESVTAGVVSATNRALSRSRPTVQLIQTDAAINPGSAGGPLVNIRGEVIGISSAQMSRVGRFDGIAYAVPINAVKEFLASHKISITQTPAPTAPSANTPASPQSPATPAPALASSGALDLGVIVLKVDDETARELKLPPGQGVMVAAVSDESIAERAGLEAGDIITHVGGRPVSNSEQFRQLCAAAERNGSTQLQIIRDDKKMTLTLHFKDLK